MCLVSRIMSTYYFSVNCNLLADQFLFEFVHGLERELYIHACAMIYCRIDQMGNLKTNLLPL